MKRLSLFKNLGLLSGATLAIAPMVLSSTSCSRAVTKFYVDQLSYSSYFDVKSENDVNRSQFKFDKILSGDTKIHNGNYIFIVGSVTEQPIDKFFTGSETPSQSRAEYYKDNFNTSVLYKTFINMDGKAKKESYEIKDFGILSSIDYFNFKFYDKKGHEILIADEKNPDLAVTKIRPFDTWGNRIKSTKTLNKKGTVDFASYEWDDTSVAAGDYIRNDDNAVAYREFVKRAITLYPKNAKRTNTFTDSKNGDNCKIACFKDGILQSIESLPGYDDPAIEKFADSLIKIYKK